MTFFAVIDDVNLKILKYFQLIKKNVCSFAQIYFNKNL